MLRKPLAWILAAASAAALLWAGAGYLSAPGTAPGIPVPVTQPPARVAPTAAAPRADGATSALPRAAPGEGLPPPGVTAEQWAALETELRARPDAAAERERLIAYFHWADAVQRWRAAHHDTALAATVDAGLADRLRHREVSAAEARALKAALLVTLEPDDSRRSAALQAFEGTLPTSAGMSAREQAFQRQQAALVAAWQARPAAERDPGALTRQLDALRRAHFSVPSSKTAPASAPGR